MPTLPSLMRTVEIASRARINVIQLTVTRETASWLADHEQHALNSTALNGKGKIILITLSCSATYRYVFFYCVESLRAAIT